MFYEEERSELTEHLKEDVEKKLLIECLIRGLKPKAATEYIEQQTGIHQHVDTIGKKLRAFDEEGDTREWLNHYTKIGYLLEQKKSLDIMLTTREDISEELFFLKKKINDERDNKTPITVKITDLTSLAHNLVELDKRIEELRLGTPIIAQIKKKIEEHPNGQSNGSILTS